MSSKQEPTFTGIKDVDLLILSRLEDEDLFNVCLANQEINQLCKDETFWRNRFYSRFSQALHPNDINSIKPSETWKNYYLEVIASLDTTGKDFFTFLSNLGVTLPNISHFVKTSDRFKYQYYYLNLSVNDKVKVKYAIGDPETPKYLIKPYKDQYMTPFKLVSTIIRFYQSPVSIKEYELTLRDLQTYDEVFDQDYSTRYTLTDIEAGKVAREDYYPFSLDNTKEEVYFIEGLTFDKGFYVIRLTY